MNKFRFCLKSLLIAVVIFIVECIIAIYVHDTIVRPFVGDLLVVILIYYFVDAFVKIKPLHLCIGVLIFSYLVEFGQYMHLVELLGLQNNQLACIIIGTSFSWYDILSYTVGILICYVCEKGGNNSMLNIFLGVVLSCNACSPRITTITPSPPSPPSPPRPNYLVVLSLDGFRWDYNLRYQTPTLDSIARHGSKAEYMIPSFPSKTFPNHYTLATGLTPDHHGIVSNAFKSPQHQAFYSLGDRTKVQDGSYYGGEPIWVTAEKQGLKTANYFWPGSEAKINGRRPSIWKPYDESVPYQARMDSIIHWLQLPYAERPNLCMFYFDEPDKSGHHFGPNSIETQEKVEHIDSLLHHFMAQLHALPIRDSINFVILADHGMEAVSRKRLYIMQDLIDTADVEYMLGSNPIIFVAPKAGKLQKVKAALQGKKGLSVWEKNEIPAHLQFGSSPNISPLVVLADSSWSVSITPPNNYFGGTHGYDPNNKNMDCIFYGIGPDFQQNCVQAPFVNTNVYNILCHLLHLVPSPNDGKQKHFNMLRSPNLNTTIPSFNGQ